MFVSGSEVYIKACNELRSNLLSDSFINSNNIDEKLTLWIGPEKESFSHPLILNYDILLNTFRQGYYVNEDLVLETKNEFKIFKELDLSNDLDHLTKKIEGLDDGQKKLAVTMFGFASKRDILYLGASPGKGWMLALEELNFEGRVIAVDPRNLDDYCKKIERYKIIHLQMALINYSQIIEIENQHKLNNYDLIWDIRSDYIVGNDVLYNMRIAGEIDLLNTLLLGYLKYVRHSFAVSRSI